MIAWGVCAGATAVLVIWWMLRCSYRPQHAEVGEGAPTVRYLIERVEAETSGGGRHRLREPIAKRGGEADDKPWIPAPPSEAPDPHEYTRNPMVLRRILAGLRSL
ncbi:hypothetical protein [Saccharopolyspora antimicrobica]|uniref:hypothetical protein n=1 Tax=Saccharopolyspora antimicrobica TaxID=455193 RepID=UPI001160209E|nr:hypothetical protein [Saccharopolyspora antimicrobica]